MTLGDFSQQAMAYRESRPTYPATLLELLISDGGLRPGDHVADFGAGTGIMTQLLVERGFQVSAIEPNEPMRREAQASPAQWITGTFEDSQLPTASQEWAIAAQAFHWADPLRTRPEIHRILSPDRLFTIVWNDRVETDGGIVEWTKAAIRRHVPEIDDAYRERVWEQILESTGHFRFSRFRTERHTISMTRDRYLRFWQSHNRLNTVAGPDRFGRFMNDLKAHLHEMQSQDVMVIYDCKAWSARRVG